MAAYWESWWSHAYTTRKHNRMYVHVQLENLQLHVCDLGTGCPTLPRSWIKNQAAPDAPSDTVMITRGLKKACAPAAVG